MAEEVERLPKGSEVYIGLPFPTFRTIYLGTNRGVNEFLALHPDQRKCEVEGGLPIFLVRAQMVFETGVDDSDVFNCVRFERGQFNQTLVDTMYVLPGSERYKELAHMMIDAGETIR